MKKPKDNFTGTGAIVGGVLGLIMNIVGQSKEKKENPHKEFDFQSLILVGMIGAIIGSVSFEIIKLLLSVFTSKEEILDEADEISYLGSVLNSYQPDEIDKQVLQKGKQLKLAIKREFSNKLLGRGVTYQGSTVQGTAVSGLSDLDILVKFKRTSFSKEEDMHDALHNFLKYRFNDTDLIGIREQKHSLGLIYKLNGSKEIIDVVPTLRTDFIRGKNEYNLFRNPKLLTGSRKLKMNPNIQKDLGDNENEKIEIIRLLKILKSEKKLPLKSILITELTKKAFQEIRMPKKLNQKLVLILNFIKDNIKTIQVKSPDNLRISLTDSLSIKDKEEINIALDAVLDDLKNDKNYLLDYFPEKS
ncbi:nucleotidyltransferase family protein [Tenacibaculum ovolyticum]|uniref:hypothetical protein n=1 Tax=Tenacibaculum ovolyticum TaxID=104270 RepID=UPI00040823ED|nr:hypothetical protein [Tenacibaculum ovolyticum]